MTIYDRMIYRQLQTIVHLEAQTAEKNNLHTEQIRKFPTLWPLTPTTPPLSTSHLMNGDI